MNLLEWDEIFRVMVIGAVVTLGVGFGYSIAWFSFKKRIKELEETVRVLYGRCDK